MSDLLSGLLSVLVATNQPAAVSNLVTQTTGLTVSVPDFNDPVEKEYRKIMMDDDAAMDEVDTWIKGNRAFAEQGGGASMETFNKRIHDRFDLVGREYQDFLKRHPNHARAHLAYGTFLTDTKHEEEGADEIEKARQLDPNNPAAWNQMANYYGHRSPVKKSFEYYEKAIQLAPTEPIYYQNMATTVYLFRKDAQEYYHLTEQEIFNKALGLYVKACELAPKDFALATDLAQTYYGIKPVRTDDALNAWTNALALAVTEVEREGVYLHLARFNLHADRFAQAHLHLNAVTNAFYADLKNRLERNLAERELGAKKTTNSPPAK